MLTTKITFLLIDYKCMLILVPLPFKIILTKIPARCRIGLKTKILTTNGTTICP